MVGLRGVAGEKKEEKKRKIHDLLFISSFHSSHTADKETHWTEIPFFSFEEIYFWRWIHAQAKKKKQVSSNHWKRRWLQPWRKVAAAAAAYGGQVRKRRNTQWRKQCKATFSLLGTYSAWSSNPTTRDEEIEEDEERGRRRRRRRRKKRAGEMAYSPQRRMWRQLWLVRQPISILISFFLLLLFFGLLFASEKRRIMSHRIITATSRQSGGLPGFLLLFPWFSFWAQAPVYCCYSPTLVLHDPGGGDDDDQEAQVAKSRLHVASIDVVFSLLLWVQFLYRLYMALDWCAFLVAKVPPNNQYVFVPKPT